jgi:hypothetical protein
MYAVLEELEIAADRRLADQLPQGADNSVDTSQMRESDT